MSEHTKGPWIFDLPHRRLFAPEVYLADAKTGAMVWDSRSGPSTPDANLIYRATEVPHTCSDPTCPGNINRQRLELWGELVEAIYNLLDARGYRAEDEARQLAKDVVTRAAAIPAPTQGDPQ